MGGMWTWPYVESYIQDVYKRDGLHGISQLAFVLEWALREPSGRCDDDGDDPEAWLARAMLQAVDERIAQKMLDVWGDDCDLYDVANYIEYTTPDFEVS